MIDIGFSKIRDGEEAEISASPIKPFVGDAGFDLTVSRDVIIAPGNFAQIPTNIAIALPTGYWAELVGRSSAFYRRWILVYPGRIDGGYRGEVMGSVYNLGQKRTTVERGDRLFQLILHKDVSAGFRWVEVPLAKLPVGSRGDAGFGSTGGFKPENTDPVAAV